MNDIFSKFVEMSIQISNKHAPMKQLSRSQIKFAIKTFDYQRDLYVNSSQATNIQIIFRVSDPALVAHFKI